MARPRQRGRLCVVLLSMLLAAAPCSRQMEPTVTRGAAEVFHPQLDSVEPGEHEISAEGGSGLRILIAID